MNDPKAAPMREDVTQADRELADAIAGALAKYDVAYEHFTLSDMSMSGRKWRVHETGHGNPFVHGVWLGEFDSKQEANTFAADLRRNAACQVTAAHRLAHTARPDAGDEDVERVARAMYEATHAGLRNCYSWDDRWEDHQEVGRERYYKEARAALAAMREGVDRGMVEREAWKPDPLNTAPKDGTYVLFAGDNFDGGMAVVHWSKEMDWWCLDDGKNFEIALRAESKLTGWRHLPALEQPR